MIFRSTAATLLSVLGGMSSIRSTSAAKEPLVYTLGNARPEGIHKLSADDAAAMGLGESGPYGLALISELLYGGVKVMDLDTGALTQVVPSVTDFSRSGVGVNYVDGLILLAGGQSSKFFAFNATSGEIVTQCSTLALEGEVSFLNGIEIVDGVVYVTDSYRNILWSKDVASLQAGTADCVLDVNELDENLFTGNAGGVTDPDTVLRSNGIVAYGSGVILADSTGGALYHVDLASTADSTVALAPLGTTPSGDGLELVTETDGSQVLYVCQNQFDQIAVFDVTPPSAGTNDLPALQFVGTIASDSFDAPATAAVSGDRLFVTNARFGIGIPADGELSQATFNETFTVSGVDRSSDNIHTQPADVTPAPTGMPTGMPGGDNGTGATDPPTGPPSAVVSSGGVMWMMMMMMIGMGATVVAMVL